LPESLVYWNVRAGGRKGEKTRKERGKGSGKEPERWGAVGLKIDSGLIKYLQARANNSTGGGDEGGPPLKKTTAWQNTGERLRKKW